MISLGIFALRANVQCNVVGVHYNAESALRTSAALPKYHEVSGSVEPCSDRKEMGTKA